MLEGPEADLGRRLREAGPEELEELISRCEGALDVPAARQLLRNPHVTAEMLQSLLDSQHLISAHEVRSGLARHPKTPQARAMQLVPSLFWRDLMEISLEPKVPPVVRRSAERHLVNRLPGLTAGEKMSIARRSGHGVLQQLRQDPEPRVVEALMENPRTTEGVLLPLVRSEAAAPEILQAVARNARWGVRYPVRVALCRNPRTPQQLALRTLTALKKPDLKAVAADARLAQPVRKRARQLLGEDVGRRTGI